MSNVVHYTEEQKAQIKYNLEKSLGPEYVSFRPAAGGTEVIYIEGWKALNLANQIFGFNGWSSEVRSTQVDYVDNMGGKWSLGLSSIVRVTLKDGTFHEDIGYGHIENCRNKAQAFEKAKKEAVTDAVKRALRQFGNVLGNCLYEKNYLQRVKQVPKVDKTTTDDDLLRPEENTRPRFDANGRLIRESKAKMQELPQKSSAPGARTTQGQEKSRAEKIIPEDSYMDDSFLFSDEVFDDAEHEQFEQAIQKQAQVVPPANVRPAHDPAAVKASNSTNATTPEPNKTVAPAIAASQAGPVGFVSTRAAKDMISNGSPLAVNDEIAFNPAVRTPLHHRNTLDPTRSAPVKRTPLSLKRSDVPSSKKPLNGYEASAAAPVVSQENISPENNLNKRGMAAALESEGLNKRVHREA